VIFIAPGLVAFLHEEEDHFAFVHSGLITLGAGALCIYLTRGRQLRFSHKEGFAIVSFGWVVMGLFGALPFLLTRLNGSFQFSLVDAFFETVSGFTTTGATIIDDVESLPRGLLLWRSLTHWLGGMGIILLFLAVLPALGAGGCQLFRAEIPGPTKDKLSPKIGQTAKTLWAIYLGITLLGIFSLKLAGMDWLESVCHTFGTVATGGFSTRNASIAAFGNWRIDAIISVLMFLCGCNFILFLQMLKGNWRAPLQSAEFKFYVLLIIFSSAVITGYIYLDDQLEPVGFLNSMRYATFQVLSILTTTGYATHDYDLWAMPCRLLLLFLMIIGGCAGSTSGGLKVFRVLITFKAGWREIFQLLRPRAILPLRVDGKSLGEELIRSILGLAVLYFVCFCASACFIVVCEGDRYDLMSLLSLPISCLSNVGPGLDAFGPTDNYSALTDPSKWCLSFLMLLGRLEIYSLLVILHRDMWRR
ncbi:MAG: TrkH family potassium uptake protein, partial [Planctomycetes bacterium]|nr:TrkH family potassium uptake protein [Planctomycetota bacterium]